MLRPQMMRVAMAFFHREEEAEDVVQEVLMRLWMREKMKEKMGEKTKEKMGEKMREKTREKMREKMREGSSDEDLTALAIKATKNLCVSTWRKQKLRQAIPLDDSLVHIRSDERADKTLLTEEQAEAIDSAIRRLPRSEQRLILLRQNADLSSEEIAALTGIPIRSVRTMISSARRNLLKLLKQ